MSTTLTDSSDSSTQKFNHLLMQIGRKPSDLFAKYDAPDLWMAIANLASLLESIPTTSESDLVAIINLSVQRLKGEMKEHVKTTLGVDLKPLSNDIVAVQNYFMQGMNVLKVQIDAEGGRTDNLVNEVNAQKSSSHFNMSTINTTATNPDISRLEGLIFDISNRLNQADNLSDSNSIKFGGLGLRSKKEVISWLAMHSPGERGGLVMDFHTLMEHVHTTITGQDMILKLNSLYKLKIETISQGAAITSFERTIPRFFSSSTSHRVVKDSASYFDNISEFHLWDQTDDGYKDKLKSELMDFQSSHTLYIDEELEAGSKIHTIATLSLAASISFTNALITFISDTYKEYTMAKFSSKKAWSITTRLASRIITYVSVPRIGVHKTFKAGSPDKIGESIFWSTLKTLDIMSELTTLGFKNSPIVASELVKFLALNTGFEVVEDLIKSNANLKTEVAELKKIAAGNTKTSQTAANKVSELKTTVDNLNKRLAKLEAKK